MSREGRGWEIPIIKEYHSSENAVERNTRKLIRRNIFNTPIRGRPIRVIVQLLQIIIVNDIKRGRISSLRWLAIHRYCNQIKDELWKWKVRGYPNINNSAKNGVEKNGIWGE